MQILRKKYPAFNNKTVLVFVWFAFAVSCNNQEKPFAERLQPVPVESGFRMDGYWVWGGSAIKVDDRYHLFVSRWPKKNQFPDDYFTESEIVRAVSSSPLGPYHFEDVVIGERDSIFWDSNMAHNPTIHKIGEEYVLFYIGSDFTTLRDGSNRLLRRVGYATAKTIAGPWNRSDKPMVDSESNNPAVLVENEQVFLMYRDEKLKIFAAQAGNFRNPFEVVNNNVWPAARLEDFYLFKKDGKYHCICEDNEGQVTGHIRWGAHLVSRNFTGEWTTYQPSVFYDHTLRFESGDTLHCTRRERPQLLIEKGKITTLFNGVYDGENSWCQPVAVMPPFPVEKPFN